MPLSLPMQVPGNLALLADGRILLSYGNRCWNNFGVDVRLSDDRGETWSPPIRIADCPQSDCGYPSSVQLPDGGVVTAYYTQVSEDLHYEMRTAIWTPVVSRSTEGPPDPESLWDYETAGRQSRHKQPRSPPRRFD